MRKTIPILGLAFLSVCFLPSCTSYFVHGRTYLADMNYAKPEPGKFRYVKRNLSVTVFWDSDKSKEEKGSKAYMNRMTSLMIQATKTLLYQAQLQHNQALYNVRISTSGVKDQYMAFFILGAAFWFESRYSVTMTADVIEFI